MDSYERRLILVCGTGGLLATIDYILFSAAPLPLQLGTLMFFAFGPLVVLGMIGLAAYLNLDSPRRVAVELAKIFGIAAGVLVNLMAVVQMTTREYFRQFIDAAPDAATKEALRQQFRGVFTVQLGVDISWDIFISIATVLFGYALLRKAGIDRWLGAAGMLAGALLLALNLATFPRPPADAGSVDVGPAVGMWFMLVSIRALWVVGRSRMAANAAGARAG